jgi:hypothetical protein
MHTFGRLTAATPGMRLRVREGHACRGEGRATEEPLKKKLDPNPKKKGITFNKKQRGVPPSRSSGCFLTFLFLSPVPGKVYKAWIDIL